jgi:hypothetical protein
MPITTLDSHGGAPALVFTCDNDHSADDFEAIKRDEPLLLVNTIDWPPSAISEARLRGWIVNAQEVLCPGCTRRRPSVLQDNSHETAVREYLGPFDESHP